MGCEGRAAHSADLHQSLHHKSSWHSRGQVLYADRTWTLHDQELVQHLWHMNGGRIRVHNGNCTPHLNTFQGCNEDEVYSRRRFTLTNVNDTALLELIQLFYRYSNSLRVNLLYNVTPHIKHEQQEQSLKKIGRTLIYKNCLQRPGEKKVFYQILAYFVHSFIFI